MEVSLLAEIRIGCVRMRLDPTHLSQSSVSFCERRCHLVLLGTISSETDALTFNQRDLFDAFWDRKRQTACARRQGVDSTGLVSRIANLPLVAAEVLSVPVEMDDGDLIEDANVLVSEARACAG